MAVSPEITALVRDLRKQGFEVVQGRKCHYKIKKDGTTIASLPSTPGGGANVVKQIIRREKKKLAAHGWEGDLTW